MLDINKELENFNLLIKNIESKKFDDFYDLECEYCKIINLGNSIRNYIIQNPSLCSEQSIKVLTNQTNNLSLLEDKYKSLLNIIYLTKNLFDKYSIYVEQLKNEQKYEEAINIYEQMFKFSKDYKYLQYIANIKFAIFHEVQECFDIYKDIEIHLYNDKDFWWQFSDVYNAKQDIFNQILCIQKALNLEET